jgi:RNA polymerase sigma-70 factor, ECF subfamily
LTPPARQKKLNSLFNQIGKNKKSMTISPEFRSQLIAAIPGLRAFGMSLTARGDRADDLVQETLMKAWKHHDSYQPGTNMKAWLYTILRNEFYTQLRKRKREVEDADGAYSSRVMVPAEQNGHLDMADLRIALEKLPEDQREAVILVGASGFSYEEAAEICSVAVGTVKSRVNRARARLSVLLKLETNSKSNAPFEIKSLGV